MKRQRCAVCSGTTAQHTGDEGCWCDTCIRLPEDARCRELIPSDGANPAVDRNVAPVGREHPATAKAAAEHVLPKTGTRRRQVYDLLRQSAGGYTDDEMEQVTALSHQTISATRNTLMIDGLVYDSGVRRLTRYGNDAIVWQARSQIE